MKINRFMIAAPASGSGKTLLTCGVLNLLKKRGLKTVSFKCGPDFIDPMFHTKVLGTPSRNLDTFFTDPETTCRLLAKNAKDADIAVMEGVMGYFDGCGLDSSKAGASDLAGITDTPVFLIVPAKGTSRSILPVIKGFLDFQEKPCICGIILNRVSAMLYPRMKEMIEKEIDIPVVGYMPVITDCALESRHLGLVMPNEIEELHEKLDRLAEILEKSLDVEQMLAIAAAAPEVNADEAAGSNAEEAGANSDANTLCTDTTEASECQMTIRESQKAKDKTLRIGLADDEAFCFFYRDNLDMIRDAGAELVPFSPVHDSELPEDLDGLWLHGGYPELYAKELAGNKTMLAAIRKAAEEKMPILAECGGFLYLHRELEDADGNTWPMAGVLPDRAWYTGRLTRFGYITLTEGTFFGKEIGPVRSHEFHYFDSEKPGDAFLASKPAGKRSWRCAVTSPVLYAGFPHLYFHANPRLAEAYLAACRAYRMQKG